MESTNPVRFGVVGVGNMGGSHVQRLLRGDVKNAVLAAVCDIDERKLGAVPANIPKYTDYKELIASGLCDAIIIATPHYFHPPIAIAAFEAGLNVLTEKPIGVYTAQAKDMVAAAEKSGKVFGIMYNQRTTPIFALAREITHSGRLGELKRCVWIITNWYRNQAYFDSGSWRATWAGEGGGVLLNQCVHNIDLWQWIFGMPCAIQGFCDYGKYHHIEVEDDVTVYAEYPNGARGEFITTTGEYPGTNRLEISGDRGKMVIENGTLKLWELASSEREFCFNSTTDTPKPEITYSEPETSDKGTAHTGIVQNFTNAILFGEELLAPGADGLKALSIINAIFLSDWKKSKVELPFDDAEYKALLDKRIEHSSLRSVQDKIPHSEDTTLKDRWSVKW